MIIILPLLLPFFAMAYMTAFPHLALFPAALYAYLTYKYTSKSSALTATLWALYAAYEFDKHIQCLTACDLRIDLLLIYPLLTGASILTLLKILHNVRRQKKRNA